MKISTQEPEKFLQYVEALLEERKCDGRRLEYNNKSSFSEPANDRRSGQDRRQYLRLR